MTLSKEDLLKSTFGFEDVEIPQGVVKVRPLTRAEALELQGKEFAAAVLEQKMIAFAMVEPKMTEAEVAEWQQVAAAGDLEPITEAIARLSGMLKESPKEAVKTFRE